MDIQEGENAYIHTADSLHCTAETNTTLQSNYIPINFFFKFFEKDLREESEVVPGFGDLNLVSLVDSMLSGRNLRGVSLY